MLEDSFQMPLKGVKMCLRIALIVSIAVSVLLNSASATEVKTWEYLGRENVGTVADTHTAATSVDDDSLSILYFPVDDAFYLWFTYNGDQSFSQKHYERAEIFIRTREVSGHGRYESDYVFTGWTVAQPNKDPHMPQFVVTKLNPEDVEALKKFDGNDIGAGYFVGDVWKTYLFPGKDLWQSFEQLVAAANSTN